MIFQRALRRELFSAAGAVFTTLFTITITFMLIKILGQAAGGKVASADVITLIGYSSLTYLPVLLILTGFISVLLVVTRCYQDSEMVVWFASGLSLTQWIKPVLRFGLPFIVLTGLLSFVATPWANRQSSELREQYEKRGDIAKVSPGKFQESASSERIFFVEEVTGDLGKVRNVFINTNKNGRSSVVVASEGKMEIDAHGDKFLVMSKGSRYDGLPSEPNFQMMEFEKYGILVAAQTKAAAGNKNAKSLSLSELLEDPNKFNRGELLWRISLPLMATILLLLAVPLGYVNPRVGRSANLIIALLLVAVYLNLLNIVQEAVVQEKLALNMAWWPMHLAALTVVVLMFSWRVKVNSGSHPLVLWSKLKCRLLNGMRSKEKSCS
ncbi:MULTISPECIES: LPS export ABC transporter permease LptF [Undibacterium]|uniref:Lipopolysaccharide export system permease protein LptF n=1 Tax=Undibacterium parvum TaxID=401471 RepID=A0A3S9HG78_9BURK|nr:MULTISPECIES: LPS export ABC transporter permease LptF [Undibacterium]AZP11103.1 LPS export ABC transporter permease LptF [Undibacterium parvum]MCX7217972.1 LPS export ABC transporter permease LptF [Burkholderiales bacterium]